ncbi:MAG: hypothetical protein MUE44_16465 [Oscillatoriaceae cyanobacterium Prado104]|nr:hypothetical protein [Oscillatoriaceae cyanobacterium Prado104]
MVCAILKGLTDLDLAAADRFRGLNPAFPKARSSFGIRSTVRRNIAA